MAQLPDRSLTDTPAEHESDHDELHLTHNQIDPDAATNGDILKLSGGAWVADTAANHSISETGHVHVEGDITALGDAHNHTESQITDLDHTGGSTEAVVVTGPATYLVQTGDTVILAISSAGAVQVTLPTVASFGDNAILVKRLGSSPVTVTRDVAEYFWTDGNFTSSKTLGTQGAHWSGVAYDTTPALWVTIGEHGTVT